MINLNGYTSCIRVAIVLALASAGLAYAAPQVKLVPQAELAAGDVTLGQLATVEAAAPEVAARLRTLPVARLNANAPARTLSRLELERIVARRLGRAATALDWDGAPAVVLLVRRADPGLVAVTRHDAVTASSVAGPVRVELPVLALANGRPGDVIDVRLPNGRLAPARVEGPGKVAL